MKSLLNIKEILDFAILKEIDAQKAYTDICGKTESQPAREALQALALQEKQHQDMLENYRSGLLIQGALRMEHPCDFHIAEHFAKTGHSAGMDLKDAFLFAADREKDSYEFYLRLAHLHARGEVRDLLERLASQELEHKATIEALLTEVAFPQTDGG